MCYLLLLLSSLLRLLIVTLKHPYSLKYLFVGRRIIKLIILFEKL